MFGIVRNPNLPREINDTLLADKNFEPLLQELLEIPKEENKIMGSFIKSNFSKENRLGNPKIYSMFEERINEIFSLEALVITLDRYV